MADISGSKHISGQKRPHCREGVGDGNQEPKLKKFTDDVEASTSNGFTSSNNHRIQATINHRSSARSVAEEEGKEEENPIEDDSQATLDLSNSFEEINKNEKVLSSKNDSEVTVKFDLEATEENSDCDLFSSEAEPQSPNGWAEGSTQKDVPAHEGKIDKVGQMRKIASVQADAEKISSLLGRTDVVLLYERLKAKRSDPNRVEKVTNELLEEGDKSSKSDGTRCSSTNTDVKSVIADISAVTNEMKKHYPNFDMDPNEVYIRLESVMNMPDRVKNVVNTLLEEERERRGECSASKTSGEEDIFQQVQQVLLKYPNADANRVFNLLEVFAEEPNSTDKVIEHLAKAANQDKKSDKQSQIEGSSSEGRPEGPVGSDTYKNDPLYKDMQKLAKIFPDRTEGEIYAHLEVYHNKNNRIELVMEEFLGSGGSHGGSQDILTLPKTSLDSVDNEIDENAAGEGVSKDDTSDIILLKFKQDVDTLKSIFPECDPKFIIRQLQDHFDSKDRVDMVTENLMNKSDYPRVKKSSKSEQQRKRLQKLRLDIPEFLRMFPDPSEVFYDVTREVDKTYKEHALLQLCSEFKAWKRKYIKGKLESHNYHYLPALREIQSDMLIMDAGMQYNMAEDDSAETPDQWPEQVDEFFYRELLFANNEDKILNYIKRRKEARAKRLELARQNNDLQECECCFEDEVLPEDMSSCPDGHLFCNECIVRSVESALTEGKAKYPCLTGTCDSGYSLSLLQEVLPAKSFSHVLRRTQEEELRQANIPDLVTCPFCPYATVMPDENDKVLRCLNPDCLKESCRLCKEPNHIPLRCDEVEKSDEIKMRTFIENKMAEAMMRICHSCKRKFYKIEGCNRMTCVCGASMCYVCREPLDHDYSHFSDNQRCNEGHMNKLHNEEAEAAAIRAREQYLQEHPEVGDITLKHDPMKGLDKNLSPRDRYDYGDDDDDEYNSDEDSYDNDSDVNHYAYGMGDSEIEYSDPSSEDFVEEEEEESDDSSQNDSQDDEESDSADSNLIR